MSRIAYSDTLTIAQQESVRANSVNAVDATIERMRKARAERLQSAAPAEPEPPINEAERRGDILSGVALNLMRGSYNHEEQDKNGKGIR